MNLPFTPDYTGKVAVVTGGAGVLCKEFCKALALCGAKVAILNRTLSKAEDVAEEIKAMGGEACGFQVNVVDKESVKAAHQAVLAKYGKCDILINGGLDAGGHEFRPGDGGTYYEISYNDAKSYAPVGEFILPMSDDFCFVDKADLDKEPQSYYLDSFFVDDLFDWYFFPSNTTIRIENGIVVAMERVYIP